MINCEKRLLRNVGKVNPVSSAQYCATGGYKALSSAIASTQENIIEVVKASGLR